MEFFDFNNDLTLTLNKVCFSSDFRMFFTSKHILCPGDMTIGVEGDNKEQLRLFLTVRHYGYDHSHNNGISDYSDAYDFYYGYFDFTDQHLDTVIEYFKTRKPELYAEFIEGVPFYKSKEEMEAALAAEEENKPILYFDMDNVLVDFQSGLDQVPDEIKAQYADDGKGKPHYDDIPGIFSKMKPVEGAEDAVKALAEKYDCYILTTSPWNNPTALQDKLDWVKRYFPDVFYKRVIISHHKNLCIQPGAYLIDDRTKHGADMFGDHHIHFRTEEFPDWKSVVEYLLR